MVKVGELLEQNKRMQPYLQDNDADKDDLNKVEFSDTFIQVDHNPNIGLEVNSRLQSQEKRDSLIYSDCNLNENEEDSTSQKQIHSGAIRHNEKKNLS